MFVSCFHVDIVEVFGMFVNEEDIKTKRNVR